MSGIPGFPLGDQWASVPSPIDAPDIYAKVDAWINTIAAFMAQFPGTDVGVEASGATGSLAVNGTVVYPTVVTNPGGGYNNATGVYTIPTAGTYICSFYLIQSTAIEFACAFDGLPSGYTAHGYDNICDASANTGPSHEGLCVQFAGGETLAVKRCATPTGVVTLTNTQGFLIVRRIGA